MLNIRLEEEKIEQLMRIAHEMQLSRRDYRLGAATVVEEIVNRFLTGDLAEELAKIPEGESTTRIGEAASPKSRTGRRREKQVAH